MLPPKPLVPHSLYLSIFPYLSAPDFPSTVQISCGKCPVPLEVGSVTVSHLLSWEAEKKHQNALPVWKLGDLWCLPHPH